MTRIIGALLCLLRRHEWSEWKYRGQDWQGKHWHTRMCVRCPSMQRTDGPILEHRPAEREGSTRIEEKRPLPPDVLMGALQDVVHKEGGTSRPAKAIRVKRPAEREGSR